MGKVRLLAFLIVTSTTLHAQSTPVALIGTVVTPTEVHEHSTVLLEHGRITAVGATIPLPKNVKTITTDDIIAPGFIDLHNHMQFNVFPRWKPIQEFGARYDWQQKPVYNMLLTVPQREMDEAGLGCDEERYAELKAIAQGETSVVGSVHGCTLGLARELDVDPRLGPNMPNTVYQVFPFQMTPDKMAAADAALAGTPRGSLLIHVSEGAPHDASAAREFVMFEQRGFLRAGVSIIHGVAIPPSGFADMAKAGVGFIWSPRSNIELYGDTADASAAKAAGVTMALAPDWSPTGSVGSLNELNYAAVWSRTQQPAPFTERELVQMVTANPARLVDLDKQIGSIAPGYAADLVLIRETRPDAFASLTHATPSDVDLVLIGGEAMFGAPALLKELTGSMGEPVKVCGADKAFTLSAAFGPTVAKLTPPMEEVGRDLAPLTECGQ